MSEETPQHEVTRLLQAADNAGSASAEQLLALVYDQLRKIAQQRMNEERAGHTLQATALVHEAYVRLVDVEKAQHWDSRGHFFAAAAEAMRRILVENARRKRGPKHGGGYVRQELVDVDIAAPEESERLLALDEALTKLAGQDPKVAELVKLRYFAGLTIKRAAEILGISPRTADHYWAYAKAWLREEIEDD